MPLSKTIRWGVAAGCGSIILFFAPLGLFMGSNLVGGLLNLAQNRKPTVDELVGDYTYRAQWGVASLHIDRNGSFRETITESGTPIRTYNGNWSAKDTDLNYLDVGLKPFGVVWDEDHETQTAAFGTQFYKPRSGATYGVINDDLGEKFTRQ